MYRTSRPVLGLALSVMALSSSAADVSFSGTLFEVATDTGGVYSGIGVGASFSGQFQFPDTAGSSTINEPDEANYELIGTSSVAQGVTAVSGEEVNVNIQNDQPIDAEVADLINDLAMPNPPAMADDNVDSWTIVGLQTGAFEMDPDPNDGDDEELLFDGVAYEFTLLSVDTSLYDSLDYRALPPQFSDVDLRIFVVREGDASGNLIYEAFGVIDVVDVTFFSDGFESP